MKDRPQWNLLQGWYKEDISVAPMQFYHYLVRIQNGFASVTGLGFGDVRFGRGVWGWSRKGRKGGGIGIGYSARN